MKPRPCAHVLKRTNSWIVTVRYCQNSSSKELAQTHGFYQLPKAQERFHQPLIKGSSRNWSKLEAGHVQSPPVKHALAQSISGCGHRTLSWVFHQRDSFAKVRPLSQAWVRILTSHSGAFFACSPLLSETPYPCGGHANLFLTTNGVKPENCRIPRCVYLCTHRAA